MESVVAPDDQTAAADPKVATLSMADRIERIKTALWVPYPEANEALAIMTRLVNAPDEGRPESFALIGEPSFGKSYLLQRFIKLAMVKGDPLGDEPSVPIVYIEMPESPEPAAMLREILSAIGAEFTLREPVDELMRKIVVLVDSLCIGLFAVDEFHKGFQGTHRQQMIMLNVVRGLSNRTQRPLILAGTEDVNSFLRNDKQLDERFIRRRLRRWREDQETRRLLKGFEQALGLKNPSELASVEMTQLIVQLTSGKLGRMSRLLVLAATTAIANGTEVIDETLLAKMARQLPGDPDDHLE